jgi:hypothetical protein
VREGGRGWTRTGHARVDFADFLDLIAILVDDPSWGPIGDQVSGVCAEVEILRNLLLERRREAQVIHVDVGEGVLEMGKGGRVRGSGRVRDGQGGSGRVRETHSGSHIKDVSMDEVHTGH